MFLRPRSSGMDKIAQFFSGNSFIIFDESESAHYLEKKKQDYFTGILDAAQSLVPGGADQGSAGGQETGQTEQAESMYSPDSTSQKD